MTKNNNVATATLNTEDELYNLIIKCLRREEAFDKIREWLNRNKDNNTRLKEALTYQGKYRRTPLHKVLEMGPPLDIVENIINCAPEALQMGDHIGMFPIHDACWNRASLEVIQALVKSYPESVKVTNNRGYLPLHCAFLFEISLDVLNFLITSYPDGIDQTNIIDQTPLDCLKESENAMKTDNKGMLPLHHACNNGNSLHLIHLLIQAYPESTNVQDYEGNTPLQYLTKAASLIDKRGMLLLHREAAHFSGLNVEMLPTLFHANPEAIQLQDKWGLLPIHHASLNEASSLEALMLLVKLYPESIVL